MYSVNQTLLKNLKTIYGITDEETKQFVKSFKSADKDKDGLIGRGDVANILVFHNLGVEKESFQLFCSEIKYTGEKLISIDEFIKFVAKCKQHIQEDNYGYLRREGSGPFSPLKEAGNIIEKLWEVAATPTVTGPSFFRSRNGNNTNEGDELEPLATPVEEKQTRTPSTPMKTFGRSVSKILLGKTSNDNLEMSQLETGSKPKSDRSGSSKFVDAYDDIASESSDYFYFDQEEDILGLEALDEPQTSVKKSAQDENAIRSGASSKNGTAPPLMFRENYGEVDPEVLEEQKRIYAEIQRKKVEKMESRKEQKDQYNQAKKGAKHRKKRSSVSETVPAVLYDPKVRKQLIKQKDHKPYFQTFNLILLLVIFVMEIAINAGFEDVSKNPLLGPSVKTVLQMGAKFVPCMRKNSSIPDETLIPCTRDIFNQTIYQGIAKVPNTNPPLCYYYKFLEEACGMGGFLGGQSTQPDQFYRFITPMFLHSGVVHFLFNGLAIWKTGFQMEEQMGSWRMFVLYSLAGIGGNLFSSVMRQKNLTVGASGAIYGLYGVLYVDLFYNWPLLIKPWKEFTILTVQVVIALCIGLLPGVDNFAHLGGFITGVLASSLFMPKIYYSKWDKIRKMTFLILSIPTLVALFTLGFALFYSSETGSNVCHWCIYLDCVPPQADWCAIDRET